MRHRVVHASGKTDRAARRVAGVLAFVWLSAITTSAYADVAVAMWCHGIEQELVALEESLPRQLSSTTTLVALEVSLDPRGKQCRVHARHRVDTDQAASDLLAIAEEKGQDWVTERHVYRELATERYRQRMHELLRARIASHPLATRATALPHKLRTAMRVRFRYEYSASPAVTVTPLEVSLDGQELARLSSQQSRERGR